MDFGVGTDMEFALKTTEVVQSASGVRRDTDAGKPQPILCFDGPMFDRWADLLTKGIAHRGKRNWMNGREQADLERFEESAVRHFRQWLRGDTDEDHAAAVFFNINGFEYVKQQLARSEPEEGGDR